jgi:hypothetical protein
MIPNLGPKIPQGRDENRRRRLPINVEVAPYADGLLIRDRSLDPIDGSIDPLQSRRRGGRIRIGLQKGAGFLDRAKPTAHEDLADQRMPSQVMLEILRNGDRRRFSPRQAG